MNGMKLRRASMTIEIACVMSLILLVLMGSLYLCFFVHNRAWLTAAAYEAALSGSMEGTKENAEVYETARIKSLELGNVGFFGAENLNSNTHADEKQVEVSYDLDTIVGYGGLEWHLRAQGSSKIIKPVTWIRKVKTTAGIVKGIGDG